MATFSLDGNIVEGAERFSSVKKSVDNVATSVNGFDTTYEDDVDCPWGIDITPLKTETKENLDTSSKRVENTQNAIKIVGTNHRNLQESLKFEFPTVAGFQINSSGNTIKPATPSSANYPDYNYGGAGIGGSCVGCDSSESSSDSEVGFDDSEFLDEDELLEEEEEDKDKQQEDLLLETIDFMSVDVLLENLDTSTDFYKTLLKYNNASYPILVQDEDGYIRLDATAIPEADRPKDIDIVGKEDRYIVACSSNVGSVGEVLRFKQNNGEIVECIVAYNNESSDNSLTFIVNQEAIVEESAATKRIKGLIENNEEYEPIQDKQFDEVENLSIFRKGILI